MADAVFSIHCVDLPEPLAEGLVPLARAACDALKLDQDVAGLRICGDDLPDQEGAWYRLQPGRGHGRRPRLELFCHRGCFLAEGRAVDAVLPPRPVWEQAPAPRDEANDISPRFHADRASVFLHHHLLAARDLVRGQVSGRHLPTGLAEGFAEAWAVGIDGRLARWGLPGFPLAERRARFARIFAPAGILLPDHWQVFEALWDGALTEQREVLEVVKRLPGL